MWLWFCTRVLGVGDFISEREPESRVENQHVQNNLLARYP